MVNFQTIGLKIQQNRAPLLLYPGNFQDTPFYILYSCLTEKKIFYKPTYFLKLDIL